MSEVPIRVESPPPPLHPRLVEILVPSRTAIINIDLQHGYVDEDSPLVGEMLQTNTKDLQAKIPRALAFSEKARAHGSPILWTQMEEDPNTAQPNMRLVMELADTLPITPKGTKWYDLLEGVKPQPGDVIIEKKLYDAFHNTQLEEELKKMGVQSLVLNGGYETMCVYQTAIGGFNRGFYMFLPIDQVGNTKADEDKVKPVEELFKTVTGFPVTGAQILHAFEQHKKA